MIELWVPLHLIGGSIADQLNVHLLEWYPFALLHPGWDCTRLSRGTLLASTPTRRLTGST